MGKIGLNKGKISAITKLETEKIFTDLSTELVELFHEVNSEYPVGHAAAIFKGFNPERLVVIYTKGTGFKQVMHLSPEKSVIFNETKMRVYLPKIRKG